MVINIKIILRYRAKAVLLCILLLFSSGSIAAQPKTPEDKELDELLNYSLEELMNIEIVSATKKKQKVSEAPAIITIITAEQIKERGYQTVGEALESVAGLDLLHDHTQYNLGIRGVNGGMRAGSRVIKLMIDSQPVSFRSSGENFLGEELIPVSVIERIEIIRGPGSTLYGANALLGVVNIITKNGDQVEGGELALSIGYGSKHLSNKNSFVVGGTVDGFNFIAAASMSRIDNSGYRLINIPGNTHASTGVNSSNETASPQSHFAKFEYSNETFGTIGVDFNYQCLDGYGEFADWGVLTHNNRGSLYNSYIRARYSQKLFDTIDLNLSFAYAAGAPLEGEKLDIDDDTSTWITRDYGYNGYDITAEARYNFDQWTNISIGFDLTSDKHTIQTFYSTTASGRSTANPGGSATGNKIFRNIGAYGQVVVYPFKIVKINFLANMEFLAGIRYDIHNIYENVLNWRVAAVYPFTDKIYTKILYGTSFKAPSSTQLYTNYIRTEGVIGNPDLDPEKVRTLEWALGGQFIRNVSLNITAFYNNVKKVELVLPKGTVLNVQAENISEINSIGGESELIFSYDMLMSYVNYSFQWSILTKEHPMRGDIKIETDLYPLHMAKFGINYKIPEIFINLNCEGRYIHSRVASEPNSQVYDPVNYLTDKYSLGAYFLLDVMISTYNLKLTGDKETEIRVKVYNVLGTEYVFPGFNGFDIPGFERTFVVSLIQKF